MILSHYSEKPFKFDLNFDYSPKNEEQARHWKPRGLWLSVGEEWKEWCERESFRTENLAHKTNFKLNLEKVIHLDSGRNIDNFAQIYQKNDPRCPDHRIFSINWDLVKKEYAGILISPFNWEKHLEYMWYYGWDCASACVWDLSVLEDQNDIS